MRIHRLVPVLLLASLLGACTDQALVDRVAQLEQSDERLRAALTELGAPDPDDGEDQAAVRAELEAVADRITGLEADLEALRATTDAQGLELDGRLTTLELQLTETRALLTQLEGLTATLSDRLTSLEAQFDAHRDLSSHDG